MNMRSSKMREVVRELPCQLNVAGVKNCGEHPSVLCHLNMLSMGKGTGIKAHDVGAAGCPACHFEVDQGKRLSREDRQFYLLRGTARTVALLMTRGQLVLVA
ncbi:MAG: DUF1364 domain-containing protein [Gammaproteobacteria bacterium]|nr:DUF1364 domain-containing protein [Gammaproteobacteria bacterium]